PPRVPGSFPRCCSSHCTLSASRWLVGSSRSSRSGFDSSSLHNATRRRSPPDRWVTGSAGGGRAAQGVHRLLELRVEIPRIGVVELFLQPAHLVHQLIGVVGGHEFGDFV